MYCESQENFFPLNVFYNQKRDYFLGNFQGYLVTEQNTSYSTAHLLLQFVDFKDKNALLFLKISL